MWALFRLMKSPAGKLNTTRKLLELMQEVDRT
jgi:hypothetical protein